MKRWLQMLALATCHVCFVTLAMAVDDAIRFRVTLVDAQLEPIRAGVVTLNNQAFKSNDRGEILITAAKARLYQLHLEAEGYYPSLQTFSDRELERWQGQIPEVTLVERIPGRVMLAFGGDVMLGRRYHAPNPGEPRFIRAEHRASDSWALLDPIRPYLQHADLVSVNLETVIVDREPAQQAPKNVVFYSYPETLPALEAAGVDYVSLGNNHSYDYLDPALEETLARLKGSGLGYSGAGMTADEALRPWTTAVGTMALSFHGFVGWPGRVVPNQIAEESKGGAALGSIEKMRQSLALSSEQALKVVQYHGSAEYSFEPTMETRQRLHAAIDAGADLVIGHHPHVLHGIEVYKGKLIAYSLGNFLFDQYIYETQRSALLYVWMDGEEFHRAELVPLYIKGYRPTPAVGPMRDDVLRRVTEQSRREGTAIAYSGGHLIVGHDDRDLPATIPRRKGAENLQRIAGWDPVSAEPDQCTVGRDWWALGDFEQEGLFGLADYNWSFSNEISGIENNPETSNYRAVLREDSRAMGKLSMRQKYFMRVWNEDPKSVTFRVRTSRARNIAVCLEKRTRAMSAEQAREYPEVRCLAPQSVPGSGQWESLSFDFQSPERAALRGLRFRIDVNPLEATVGPRTGRPADVEVAPVEVQVDDIQFISWEAKADDHRVNVLRCH